MTITAALAAFSAGVDLAETPEPVIERTRLLATDLIGCIVRANQEAPSLQSLRRLIEAMGLGSGSFGVFGDAKSYAPTGAVFLNAALGHALDFDDTHAAATSHPGAPVIPAAIAAGEMVGASGAEVTAGIIAGYEVMCRTALGLPAGDHYARGFHPTATCGVFGAAAAAGRVLRLSAEQIERALGIALSQSAGSLQFLVDGAWTKPFQVGWAAMSGFSAALLAREDFRGPLGAIEGKHGFLNAYAPNPRPDRVIEKLGADYELMKTGIKPYPSCRYGHAGIDAVLALRQEHGLTAPEVERITYGLSNAGLLLVGAPAEIKRNPVNLVGAQFSAPFVLATALATGAVGWDSYGRINDPEIHALMQKVDCVHDDEIEAEFPANMSGRITIEARGQRFERKLIVPLGEPSNFLSRSALLDKFEGLARPVLGDRWKALAVAALTIDEADRIDSLLALGRLTRNQS